MSNENEPSDGDEPIDGSDSFGSGSPLDSDLPGDADDSPSTMNNAESDTAPDGMRKADRDEEANQGDAYQNTERNNAGLSPDLQETLPEEAYSANNSANAGQPSTPSIHDLFDDPYALGDFQLKNRIGSGGYGEVFRAVDRRLQRDVAIKIIKQDKLNDPTQRGRFLDEARNVAQLRHPNIVPVYQFGKATSGVPFVIYEFIDGPTLRKLLWKKKRLQHEEAVSFIIKIADGLGYAHELGIVHRDVKPANILIDDATGEPHIADFGCSISRELGRSTRDREFVGTMAYFSPEQAAGKSYLADARTDVWALGVIMDEIITGQRLYAQLARNDGKETDVEKFLSGIQNFKPTPLSNRIPIVDKDLNAIWQKCLQLNPDDRYSNGRELADDLRRWQRSEPVRARHISLSERMVRWARRNPQVATSLAAVFASVLAAAIIATVLNGRLLRKNYALVDAAVERLVSGDPETIAGTIQQLSNEDSIETANSILVQRSQSSLGLDDSKSSWRLALGLAALDQKPPQFAKLFCSPRRTVEELQAACEALAQTKNWGKETSGSQTAEFSTPANPWLDTELAAIQDGSSNSSSSQLKAVCGRILLGNEKPVDSAITAKLLYQVESIRPGESRPWVNIVRQAHPNLSQQLENLAATFDSFSPDVDVVNRLLVAATDNHIDLLKKLGNSEQPLATLLVDLKRHIDKLPEPLGFAEFATLAGDKSIFADPRSTANAWHAYLYCCDLTRDKGQLDNFLLRPVRSDTSITLPDALNAQPPILDQTAQTIFVCDMFETGIPWNTLATLADHWHEQNDDRLAAVLIALGDYPRPANIPHHTNQLLQKIWIKNPRSGVHSACEWVMRKWNLPRPTESLPREYSDIREWRHDGERLWIRIRKPETPFMMGSNENKLRTFDDEDFLWEPDDERYEVAHPHEISGDFEITAYEVTESQFKSYIDTIHEKPRRDGIRATRGSEAQPAARLDWYAAAEFCNWLSAQHQREPCYGIADEEGKLASDAETVSKAYSVLKQQILACDRTADGYRLPTNAEWEYVCRAGTTTLWPFGENSDYIVYFANTARSATDGDFQDCGSLIPNAWGAFDMIGNAAEWTDTPSRPLPAGVLAKDAAKRISKGTILSFYCCGGDSNSPISEARTARRIAMGVVRPTLGFRIVRKLP